VTGLLDQAVMITADAERDAAVVLGTTVRLDRPQSELVSARLWSTAHGVYEVRIGGRPVSEAVLAPGWTSYEWRLQVQETDVTALVSDGAALEVVLGNGWWRGELAFSGADLDYGSELGFVAELVLTFADGATRTVATGPDWGARRSEVVVNDLYDGQRIDARLRGAGEPLAVREVDFDRSTLVPQVKPPVTRQEQVRPQRIWTSPAGRTLVDFGQNLVGWIRLRARGEAGSEITLRHAEVLEHDELGVRPLRGARATDTFVLSGGDDEFEPTLTFHGFRYAEVTGFPGELTTADLEAVVIHSEMARTGSFECSSNLVNRLVENSVWGQKGNFLDLPTDCPQRDERLGWTGDIAVYAPTACYQFDVADLLHGWLLDVLSETEHGGYVPVVVPDVLKLGDDDNPVAAFRAFAGPKAVWSDAAVWVPEALWRAYGDLERLADHYPGMVAHLRSVEPLLSESGLWDRGWQLGDWLDPTAPPDNPLAAKADSGVVATACLFRSASFAAETAGLLGHSDDARRWAALAQRLRSAFLEHYVDGDSGRIRSDAPTVYALAIVFGLLDDDTRAVAAQRLAELVAENGYRIATGFAGTPYVTWALSETGHVDTAYRLLLETGNPSWLYSVTMGATTIWERFDAMLPDGSINPGEMTSFNHYALGGVADWLYQCVAGIRPAAPGYARLLLQPTPGAGLDWARGALDTRHGHVECGWRRTGDVVEVTAVVPPGVEADVVLPWSERTVVGAGTHTFRSDTSPVRLGGPSS
jgi:alpha-L-rhamnosidase